MGLRISKEKEDLIHSLRAQGWKQQKIADHLGVSISCVRDHLNPGLKARRQAANYKYEARAKADPEKMERIRERRHEYYLRKKIRSILGDDHR
ncbi:hypothetical protein EVB68_072 [Rhizobium phage RHph_Y2_6]|uniref:Uncharacterized protein n=2 Tax=Acanvirus TaxID=3044653 RepID=A0AAE8AW25_9CAUD|nr:hypothetical protein PP748_gp072 [Rhizobium phage RHph_Y2_6]YP_010658377.1 hypothetical protein PP750_gp67 [Rhizobium phage RHEph16]QIG68809.1 hypothetical protein EVB68_072 [Rhizobium phage RHph_Y2_6]QXV74376.1 hypothetical protein [Rhizobium phage RHEph16]